MSSAAPWMETARVEQAAHASRESNCVSQGGDHVQKKSAQNAQVRAGLLTPEERDVCKEVAAREAPYSQRALALMALDQGVTQAEAGELSGLTQGQVRYWRDRFRQKRLGIFPDDLLAEGGSAAKPKSPPEQALQPERRGSARPVQIERMEGKPKKTGKAAKKGKKAKGVKTNPTAKADKKSKQQQKDAKTRVKDGKGKAAEKPSKKSKKEQKDSKREKGAKKGEEAKGAKGKTAAKAEKRPNKKRKNAKGKKIKDGKALKGKTKK